MSATSPTLADMYFFFDAIYPLFINHKSKSLVNTPDSPHPLAFSMASFTKILFLSIGLSLATVSLILALTLILNSFFTKSFLKYFRRIFLEQEDKFKKLNYFKAV